MKKFTYGSPCEERKKKKEKTALAMRKYGLKNIGDSLDNTLVEVCDILMGPIDPYINITIYKSMRTRNEDLIYITKIWYIHPAYIAFTYVFDIFRHTFFECQYVRCILNFTREGRP